MTFLFKQTEEWTFDLLERAMEEIRVIADDELKLSYYPIQIEIVDSEEMLNLYSANAMPHMYNHWSFGKEYILNSRAYNRGAMGLAFEIIQNTNPSIAYCMDTNTPLMQTLVLAHASIGHNSFFKCNYLFKEWTDASGIIDYMLYAKGFISKCEEEHGSDKVEELLDCCHSLQFHGIDKYSRPNELTVAQEKDLQKERVEAAQQEVNVLWSTLPFDKAIKDDKKKFPSEPEENLLFFLEKHSPILESWEREIVRIVRKLGQYWYPNMQTKMINEGWATFIHYQIMNRLWEKKLIDDGSYLEFIRSHTSVVFQPTYNEARVYPNGMIVPIFSGINPYALGFEMFMDVKRICEEPTPEDKEWFPDIAGKPWLPVVIHIMENYRDESFVLQYLSPALMRKWKFFYFKDHGSDYDFLDVKKIHNESGYKEIRKALARSYDINHQLPNLAVWEVDIKGTRKLELRHYSHDGVTMSRSSHAALKNFVILWGFDVNLKSVDMVSGKTLENIEASPPGKEVVQIKKGP